MRIYTSAWVAPISSPPIRDGAIAVEGDEIVAVGPGADILRAFGDRARADERRGPSGSTGMAGQVMPAAGALVKPSAGALAIPAGGARGPIRAGVVDLGEAIVLPAFVNAHTHLELSWMQDEPPPQGDPMAWIRAMIGRRNPSPEEVSVGVDRAIAAVSACGTALVGDVGNTSAALEPLLASDLGGRFFLELTGGGAARNARVFPDAERDLESALARAARAPRSRFAADRLREHDSAAEMAATAGSARAGTDGVPSSESRRMQTSAPTSVPTRTRSVGISIVPHSPTIVEPELLRQIADRASRRGDWVSIHLSESSADAEFLERGSGPFRPLMEQLGRLGPGWRPAGLSPARVLDAAGLLGPRTLAVHGVHLTRGDVRLLAARGTSVVLCPRSNAWIGVGEAPVAMFREEGLRAALGTDSLASNADLDIFAELAALARLARGLPADWILRAATLGGAEALGMASEFGSIEPGKRASLLALRKRPRTQATGRGGAHHTPAQDSSGAAQGAPGWEGSRAEYTTEPASAILQEAEPYATIFGGPSEVALTVLT